MKLFKIADQYCKESTWKTLALLKFCLFSMGLMIGISIPKKEKSLISKLAMITFITTYIPLMLKLLKLWEKDSKK